MATGQNIEVPIEAESSSDYDTDSLGSDLTSVASSVYNYVYENGRRYHSYRAGKYMLPNDEKEQDRLDLLHHIFRLSLDGKLCRSTLDNPMKVLDVGTGTGIWAIELGDEFPAAEVVGMDVSPIQPEWVPPNVRFQVDDATDQWAFPENSFDFIHVRTMAGSIKDWPQFLNQAYKHLKPGGQIELSEGRTHFCCDDGTYDPNGDTAVAVWVREFHRIAGAIGLDFDVFPKFAEHLKQAGFENVVEDEHPCPVGSWPKNKKLKEIGKYFKHQFLTGAVDSYTLALFTRAGGWSEQETQALIAEVRNNFRTNRLHAYTHLSFCIANKPQI